MKQKGFAPILILVAVVGILGFILIANFAPVKKGLLSAVFPKTNTYASSPYNPGDTDGDLDVDIFDYNDLLSAFGQSFNNGDFDGNGKVDIFDFNILLSNWGKKYTAGPSSSPASSGGAGIIEGVTVCTDHDITKWHALVKKDTSGNINCTYGHEHHDDPNLVNDIFGSPGVWYGGNQSISYPWQTFAFTTPAGVMYPTPSAPTDPAKLENALKHNGYKWYVKRDLPCIPFAAPPNDGCIRAWRVLFHTLGTTADSTVRFHSFGVEALVEYQGKQGIVRGGGWMNAGGLTTLVDGGNKVLCPEGVITNPPNFICPNGNNGNIRETYSTNVPAPYTPHANPGATVNWYAAHRGVVQAGPQVEDFGPTDYADPFKQLFYDPKYKANNSHGNIENFSINTLYSYLAPFKNAAGLVNVKGYEDRHGNYLINGGGCTQPSVDCVPFSIENAPAAIFQMNRNTNRAVFDHGDHDVISPVTGKSLIVYPN